MKRKNVFFYLEELLAKKREVTNNDTWCNLCKKKALEGQKARFGYIIEIPTKYMSNDLKYFLKEYRILRVKKRSNMFLVQIVDNRRTNHESDRIIGDYCLKSDIREVLKKKNKTKNKSKNKKKSKNKSKKVTRRIYNVRNLNKIQDEEKLKKVIS